VTEHDLEEFTQALAELITDAEWLTRFNVSAYVTGSGCLRIHAQPGISLSSEAGPVEASDQVFRLDVLRSAHFSDPVVQ